MYSAPLKERDWIGVAKVLAGAVTEKRSRGTTELLLPLLIIEESTVRVASGEW